MTKISFYSLAPLGSLFARSFNDCDIAAVCSPDSLAAAISFSCLFTATPREPPRPPPRAPARGHTAASASQTPKPRARGRAGPGGLPGHRAAPALAGAAAGRPARPRREVRAPTRGRVLPHGAGLRAVRRPGALSCAASRAAPRRASRDDRPTPRRAALPARCFRRRVWRRRRFG